MSLLGKIKYYFDGAEEAEESGLILSRRKFFIGSAALLVVGPTVIEALNGVPVSEMGQYGVSPLELALARYQEEMFKQVKTEFVLKPMISDINFTMYDIGAVKEFDKMILPLQRKLDRDLLQKLLGSNER